jgi:ATP-dependent protease ClpP protease subunit
MKRLFVFVLMTLFVGVLFIPANVLSDGTVCEETRPYMGGSLSSMSFMNEEMGKAYIKIFSGITKVDVARVWNDIVYLADYTQIRDLTIWLNSPGGDAFAGLALSDELLRAKKMGFHITIFASGIVASAAVPIFAICDYRIVSPNTIFMVHETALWKWPGRETHSDIKSQNRLMDMLRDHYLQILADNSNLTVEEWGEMEHRTTWFSSEKALKWELADEIN